MKLRPLQDRVVVRRHDAEEKTPGGIVIPDNAKEKNTRGEVLAVGPGKLLDSGSLQPLGVQVGDVVLFGKYAGTDVDLDGEKVVVLREDDLICGFEK